jgi:hypothetical protein
MNTSLRILTGLLVGLSCFIGGSAWAQPSKKGGGSGDGGSANNGGGVIYFTYSPTSQGSQLYQMSDDGSGVTALPIPTSQLGSPSYQLHAGWGKDSRLIRAINTGGSKTRLTSKSQFGSGPSGPTVIGWRANN